MGPTLRGAGGLLDTEPYSWDNFVSTGQRRWAERKAAGDPPEFGFSGGKTNRNKTQIARLKFGLGGLFRDRCIWGRGAKTPGGYGCTSAPRGSIFFWRSTFLGGGGESLKASRKPSARVQGWKLKQEQRGGGRGGRKITGAYPGKKNMHSSKQRFP